jgi:phage shock protein A
MPDSVFVRVERIVRTSADRALELAERASGVVLVREAARELEQAEQRLRSDRQTADRKGQRAAQAQKDIRAKLAELTDHARYALGKGREDLARAAVARQVELEKETGDWETIAAEAKVEAKCIDDALAQVAARRKQIQTELAALEREQSASAPARAGKEGVQDRVAKAMDKADRIMERAKAERGPIAEPAEAARAMADIAAMKRDDAIEERLAALKASADAKRKARKRA